MVVTDLNSPLLDHISHRPWALPPRPWAGHMRWCDLAFMHWAVDPELVRPLIPPELELETYDDKAWIGIVPFRMEDVRLRFMPNVPGLSVFPELNVRTYVRFGTRFGVWFFSLDAANRIAVRGARTMFNLPYYDAEMSIDTIGDGVRYRSERTHHGAPPASFAATYSPNGPVYHARPGTLDYFLVERYCLFTMGHSGELGTLDIHHLPWPLQPAVAAIEINTMASASGLRLPDEPPLVHFVRDLEVLAWNREALIE